MSANYEVQVEIVPCAEADLSRVRDVLKTWGLEIEDQCESFDDRGDGWSIWGTMVVSADDNLDTRHQILAEQLSDRWVRTRWRYLDDLPWDEDLESEPMNPSVNSIPTIQPIQ